MTVRPRPGNGQPALHPVSADLALEELEANHRDRNSPDAPAGPRAVCQYCNGAGSRLEERDGYTARVKCTPCRGEGVVPDEDEKTIRVRWFSEHTAGGWGADPTADTRPPK